MPTNKGSYEGAFVTGKRDGKGIEKLANGDSYGRG